MSRFEELRQQAAQNGRPIAVIVCDLDHFKDVNDRHGHDRAMSCCVRRPTSCARQPDRSS
jgi:diguanylate cyclase (GGDEF)-like protein